MLFKTENIIIFFYCTFFLTLGRCARCRFFYTYDTAGRVLYMIVVERIPWHFCLSLFTVGAPDVEFSIRCIWSGFIYDSGRENSSDRRFRFLFVEAGRGFLCDGKNSPDRRFSIALWSENIFTLFYFYFYRCAGCRVFYTMHLVGFYIR
jgi:hypothetical protein